MKSFFLKKEVKIKKEKIDKEREKENDKTINVNNVGVKKGM